MFFRPQATAEYANADTRGVLLSAVSPSLRWLLALASIGLLALIAVGTFGRVRISVDGQGELRYSEGRIPVLAPGAVKVSATRVFLNQKVKQGEALFDLDTSEIQSAAVESARHLDKLRDSQSRAESYIAERRTASGPAQSSQDAMLYMLTQHLERVEDLLQKEQERAALLHRQAARTAITSPASGTVVELTAQPGVPIKEGEVLASLLPSTAALRAYVQVPESEIARIERDSLVYLRFHAYPYESFGMAEGHVLRVFDPAAATTSSAPSSTPPSSTEHRLTAEVELTRVPSAMQLRAGLRVRAAIVTGERSVWSLISPG